MRYETRLFEKAKKLKSVKKLKSFNSLIKTVKKYFLKKLSV